MIFQLILKKLLPTPPCWKATILKLFKVFLLTFTPLELVSVCKNECVNVLRGWKRVERQGLVLFRNCFLRQKIENFAYDKKKIEFDVNNNLLLENPNKGSASVVNLSCSKKAGLILLFLSHSNFLSHFVCLSLFSVGWRRKASNRRGKRTKSGS